jgi:peptide/nickel transport system substrate-binding protein
VLLRNEAYFERDETGRPLPHLDAVEISFVPDKGAAFLDLLKGRYDFMSGLHGSYKDELLTPAGQLNALYSDKLYLQRHPFLKTDYLGFVVSPAAGAPATPWHRRDLRRAVSYAIDREALVRYLRNNVYTPAGGGFIPAGMPGYNARAGYSYRPDSVRAILRRAGYPDGKGLPTLRLSATSDYADICEFVQHQLGRFGISCAVDILPASVHRELSARGELEFFRKSWLADYPDDENFMALFYGPNQTPAGPNYFFYRNPLFDRMYEEAMHTTHPVTRTLLYARMDSIAMSDAPAIALYYDVVMRFVSHRVSGLDASPMNVLDLRRVKVTQHAEPGMPVRH